MALKFAIKGVGAKVETTKGADPTITGADALQTIGFDITPIEANVVDLEQDRSTLGAVEQVSIGNGVSCTFGVYMAGRGSANSGNPYTRPAYDAVIQGAGFGGRAHNPQDWATGTSYAVGDIVTVSSTFYRAIAASTGATTNNPSTGSSKDDFWAEVEDWAVATTVATGDIYASGGNLYRAHTTHTSSADNSPTSVNFANFWHVYGASYIYRPNSNDPKTVWIDSNLDGNTHILKSARGNMSCALTAGALPQYQFTYQGFYVDPARTTQRQYQYGTYNKPQGVTSRDTRYAVIHGQRVVMNSLNFDLGNEIVTIDEPGSEAIELNNRSISGNIIIEMPPIDTFNWFNRIRNLTGGGLFLEHGRAGNRTTIFAPNVTLSSPSIEDNAGRYMLNIPLRFVPRDGDDDIEIRTL